MSDFTFKPAAREAVPLLLGLIGQSGSGKTYSAMRIASGIVGKGNKFAVIDTESRRALHYADKFKDQYDHCPFEPPFTPERYAEAIRAADKAGYKAIVVDSMSHEWAGEGGVLDWQEEELTRMAGDDWRKRETCKMAAWIKPKMAHKQMVSRLLQVKAHIILCFRAEDKVKMEKDDKGKMQIVPIGLQPICSKEMPYELMASFMLHSDNPGYPIPLKLQEQHKAMFPLDKLLNEESGALIAAWARGGATPAPGANSKGDGKHLFSEIHAHWCANVTDKAEAKTTTYDKLNEYCDKAGVSRVNDAAGLESLTAEECKKIRDAFADDKTLQATGTE